MNFKIKDSYKFNLDEIKDNVVYYYNCGLLDKRRSINSYVEEWYAHNWLYKLGLFKSHTKDTDLDGDEQWYRLIAYKIIYLLFQRRKTDE